jgi:hypothetical protein
MRPDLAMADDYPTDFGVNGDGSQFAVFVSTRLVKRAFVVSSARVW